MSLDQKVDLEVGTQALRNVRLGDAVRLATLILSWAVCDEQFTGETVTIGVPEATSQPADKGR